MKPRLQQIVRSAPVQRAISWTLTSGTTELSRRHAAFLFDIGAAWQPASFAKRRHLLGLFEARGHRTLVESGTYEGDTVAAFVGRAERIVSVELEPGLAARAAQRFADEPSVQIIAGDATTEIPRVVAETADPPLVWLDSHFSGDQTAMGDQAEPAVAILGKLADAAAPGTTIVVDDLRLFGLEPDFPGLDELVAGARGAFPAAAIRVGLDSLVIEA